MVPGTNRFSVMLDAVCGWAIQKMFFAVPWREAASIQERLWAQADSKSEMQMRAILLS